MAREGEGYNGYANYATWNVALWIDNDPGLYGESRDMARSVVEDVEHEEPRENVRSDRTIELADRLEAWITEMAPDLGASMFGDILQHALRGVNWYEIAENYIEEVEEEEREEAGA